jgi:predicted DNA-binding transcriptional regulator YafY
MDRIRAALPLDLRIEGDTTGLLVPHFPSPGQQPEPWQTALRQAMRARHKIVRHCQDQHGVLTQRPVWPFAMAYCERSRVVSAGRELRQDFRHIRADRVHALHGSGARYPDSRQQLIRRWLDKTGPQVQMG